MQPSASWRDVYLTQPPTESVLVESAVWKWGLSPPAHLKDRHLLDRVERIGGLTFLDIVQFATDQEQKQRKIHGDGTLLKLKSISSPLKAFSDLDDAELKVVGEAPKIE